MATYKYQQNVFEGASYGYVKYNITPDFGSYIAPGDIVKITGQAYCKNMAVKSIEVKTSAPGVFKSSCINKSMAKATATTFTIEFPMWTLSSEWGTGRVLSAPIEFNFWSGANIEGNGIGTVNVSGQAISYLQYRIGVMFKNVKFERCALRNGGYVKDDEGTLVMGGFGIRLTEGCGISNITVATVHISSNGPDNGQTKSIPTNVLSAALSQSGYIESAPSLFASVNFNTAYNYTLLFTIGDAYNTYSFSVFVARAFANVHMSGCSTGGVAFGKFSSATEGHPLFECEYPAIFSAGISGVGVNAGQSISFPAGMPVGYGFISGSSKDIYITINLGTPLNNISSVSMSGTIVIRNSSGYITQATYDAPMNVTSASFTRAVHIIPNTGMIYMLIRRSNSTAFGGASNNTPLSVASGTTPLTLTFS